MMGNRLREILERERVRANWLSRDLKIDRSQISRFFSGKGSISLKKLEQIAQYLGYDIRFVKLRPSRKGGGKWDVSIGEEKSIGSSTTGKAKRSWNPPGRIKKK